MTGALVLLLSVAPAARDLATSLEGQPVGSVRIDAPAAVAARLSRYLELTPGEPLHASQVRHIVELFHATGEFQDVVVEVRRGEAGLELVFRPVPAPLLASVRVQGDRVLSPGKLRSLSRLRPGEPLWPTRLDDAARDAARALAEQGYLEARVSGSARRLVPARVAPRAPGAGGPGSNPARRDAFPEGRADAVFAIEAGPRAVVTRAAVDGVAPPLAHSLRALIDPRPGHAFRRPKAVRAAERMRRRLVAAGHWRAAVEHHESYEPGTGRTTLVFRANAGPRTRVEFRGARVAGSLRDRVEDLLREGALKGDVIEEATDLLEEDFRGRGHRYAAVAVSEEPGNGSATLAFDVRPGPAALVASVRFSGDAVEDLDPVLATREGEPLQERLVDQDVRTLVRALQERGHPEARVEAEVPESGTALAVAFRIETGPRTLVGSVSVDSPVKLPADAGARELRLRAGVPYSVSDLARDRNTLASAYRDAGFLQAEVIPEVAFSGDRTAADVALRVVPGPRTDVEHVVIAGLHRTREEVVLRELQVDEGGPLGLQKVLESQRRLGALGIFHRVTISEMDPESVGSRSLVVTAEEAPPVTIAYGIGYSERDLVRGSVEVTRRNLFGMDRSLSTFARGSFKGSRFFTTFREPYLLGHKQELFVTAYREEEDRPSFDFVRYGGLLQSARALTDRWSLIVRYTFQETDLFQVEVPLDEVDRQFRSTTTSGPSASLVNDTRDDPLDPRRGRFLGADVQLSHAVLGGDSFLKGFLQAAAYERVTGHVLVALSGRLGLARTFGEGEPLRLPLGDRFFAGGDYSLRGYAIDTAGPLELSPSGRLVPSGGNALLVGGAELRVDAGRFVSLAAFSEAGNVYPLVSDVDLGDLRYTAGLGVRYRSALGPLRIDWGYKLNRRQGEKPYRFHFTIGHAF